MKARDVMQTNVITIHKDASYEEAGRLLYTHNISGMPVIDDTGMIVGMISEKDLFRVLFPWEASFHEQPEMYIDLEERERKMHDIRKNAIKKFMIKEVIAVHPDDPVMKIGAIMLARNINRLPVVEDDTLVGIISRKEIFKNILRSQLDV